MDWKSQIESAKTTAATLRGKGAEVVGATVDQHWPAIQQVLRDRVAPAIVGAAENDELIVLAAKLAHSSLPLPIRLVVRQPALTEWCLANRTRVLTVLNERRVKAFGAAPERTKTDGLLCCRCATLNKAQAKFCRHCGAGLVAD